MFDTNSYGNTALQKKSADLVHQRDSTLYPALPYPMKCLQIELLMGLDWDITHGRPQHCLGNRLSVDEVILVGLYIRTDIFRRHQPDIVALIDKSASKEMRSATCLHPDDSSFQVCCVNE